MKTTNPVKVGNTTGGSWHGVISNYSANPEATYSLLSLMAIKPASIWLAQNGWTGVDPGFTYQFLEPQGEAGLEISGRWLVRGRCQGLPEGLL